MFCTGCEEISEFAQIRFCSYSGTFKEHILSMVFFVFITDNSKNSAKREKKSVRRSTLPWCNCPCCRTRRKTHRALWRTKGSPLKTVSLKPTSRPRKQLWERRKKSVMCNSSYFLSCSILWRNFTAWCLACLCVACCLAWCFILWHAVQLTAIPAAIVMKHSLRVDLFARLSANEFFFTCCRILFTVISVQTFSLRLGKPTNCHYFVRTYAPVFPPAY